MRAGFLHLPNFWLHWLATLSLSTVTLSMMSSSRRWSFSAVHLTGIVVEVVLLHVMVSQLLKDSISRNTQQAVGMRSRGVRRIRAVEGQ